MTTQTVYIDSMEFEPKNQYVLVKPEALQRGEIKAESGVIIAIKQNTSSLDRPTSGTVIASGEDIEDIVDGDYVVWPGTDGLDIEFNDGTFMLLRYKSIIGCKKR